MTERLIELENAYIFEGGTPEVLPEDDHRLHIKGHEEGCSKFSEIAKKHIAAHREMLRPV